VHTERRLRQAQPTENHLRNLKSKNKVMLLPFLYGYFRTKQTAFLAWSEVFPAFYDSDLAPSEVFLTFTDKLVTPSEEFHSFTDKLVTPSEKFHSFTDKLVTPSEKFHSFTDKHLAKSDKMAVPGFFMPDFNLGQITPR
jgi:hypothetical protein